MLFLFFSNEPKLGFPQILLYSHYCFPFKPFIFNQQKMSNTSRTVTQNIVGVTSNSESGRRRRTLQEEQACGAKPPVTFPSALGSRPRTPGRLTCTLRHCALCSQWELSPVHIMSQRQYPWLKYILMLYDKQERSPDKLPFHLHPFPLNHKKIVVLCKLPLRNKRLGLDRSWIRSWNSSN